MSILDAFRLDGKTALMTGGAGLYGRQIARALAEAGARTYMASRDVEKLERQAQTFRDEGLNVTACRLDQSDEDQVLALRDHLLKEADGVDVLVNNAVLRPMSGWNDDQQNLRRSMDVNLVGTFLMTRAFGNDMAGRGKGSIINIGSIMGMIGPDFSLYEGLGMGSVPDYFMHKGGMMQLTRYAAAELGPRGVRVNQISPGGLLNDQLPQFIERYNARTFLGRMANHTDLMGAIVFLASDASVYVTGANLPVDGGYTAK